MGLSLMCVPIRRVDSLVELALTTIGSPDWPQRLPTPLIRPASVAIYTAGFFVAFVLGPILSKIDNG
jgi:hypothetical protein